MFFESESVTFTGINRAKGNEVPMVYIINAQDCYAGSYNSQRDLIKKRNILFTAITRSKAWVRILGVGDYMEQLIAEYYKTKSNNFELFFKYPTPKEIERLNVIHRDITAKEKQRITHDISAVKEIAQIMERIKNKQSHIEDYPEDIQIILQSLLGE